MKKATQVAHWSGRDVPVCVDHAKQLQALAEAMGLLVTMTPCEETVCTNCLNAAAKKGAR
jgi:hypothetical protein